MDIRLAEALKILKEERVTVSEVAYRVGFKHLSYFTSSFHDHFGFPPGEAKHVNLENANLYQKREISSDQLRFSINKKYAFIALFCFVVIVSMVAVFFHNRDKNAIKEKSIAVLPFKCIGDDTDTYYLAEGMWEAILFHLSRIEDMRVIDRTSVEQYRETDKAAIAICKELDVAFLLEGSFQKFGDQAKLVVRLIRPENRSHNWVEEYDMNWEDIFFVQRDVAQRIAEELQAVITPMEQQLIEKKPTASPTAYYFYLRGREEKEKYLPADQFPPHEYDIWLDEASNMALNRAEEYYNNALEHDSSFALAYTGLAWVYWYKNYWQTYLTEDFLDSALALADMALSFEPELSEAYVMRGFYYERHNQGEKALREFDKAIGFNPNEWQAYYRRARVYFADDYIRRIQNYQKAASLQRGPILPRIYRDIGLSHAHAGFKEIAIDYAKNAYQLDGDSAKYYYSLGLIEDTFGNLGEAMVFLEKSYSIDSTDPSVIRLVAQDYAYMDQFEESLEYYKKYEERLRHLNLPLSGNTIFLIGYAYEFNGYNKEAEFYFKSGLEFQKKLLEMGRSQGTLYSLAGIYAHREDKANAYEYLRLFNQRPRMPIYMIKNFKYNPLFDKIRNEPEFQQFLQDVEDKYQAEHERVGRWLEEKDMI
jgi:TolB-like protein/Tfp pilus assembly protein PilF